MKRVKLVVAYDGTNYCGWQLQPNGVTIEEVLNQALSQLLKEPVMVIGASRTDSGVHARGNVAVFDTENRMPADKICFAVNQRLPEDIRVLSSQEVPLTWHPRKANCTKTYEYKILNRKISMPLERLYSHFCYVALDVEKMRRGAAYLVGEHDFKSFCTVRTQAEETVRTIYSLDVEKDGSDMITIRISGSGFLYNMVRIIAGTLLKVGMGVYPPEHVEEILEARDRQAAGQTAPARGLTLMSMEYETELPAWEKRENRHWKYAILQSQIPEHQTAVFFVERCEDEEWERLLRRNIHHAFQNGARQVLIADLEREQDAAQGAAKGVEPALEPEPDSAGEQKAGQKAEQQAEQTPERTRESRLREGGRYGYYVLKKAEPSLMAEIASRVSRTEREEAERILGETAISWYLAVDGGKAEGPAENP